MAFTSWLLKEETALFAESGRSSLDLVGLDAWDGAALTGAEGLLLEDIKRLSIVCLVVVFGEDSNAFKHRLHVYVDGFIVMDCIARGQSCWDSQSAEYGYILREVV